MEKLNVFVYDTSRGFSRFLKSNYQKEFTIDTCYYSQRFWEIEWKEYDCAFVMINGYEDLPVLLELDTRVKYIFVSSPFLDTKKILSKSCKRIPLGTELLRTELLKIIDGNIAMIQSNAAVSIELFSG
jgi:hypothetical protein